MRYRIESHDANRYHVYDTVNNEFVLSDVEAPTVMDWYTGIAEDALDTALSDANLHHIVGHLPDLT